MTLALRLSIALLFASFCIGSAVADPAGAAGDHSQHLPLQHAQMQMHTPAGPTFKAGDIAIETPWLRATPRGAQVAGAYMKITNSGKEPDRLIGGTLDRARSFEVHEMTMVNNVMRMRALPNGLEIKPGETVELKPGGSHIMGLDLQGGYAQGQTVKGTLKFEKAGTVSVEYAVGPIGGGPPMAGH